MNPPESPPRDLLGRFRTWLLWGMAGAALIYLGASIWAGLDDMRAALTIFWWPLYIPAILLTLLNYGLRFWKWQYLLRRVGVVISLRENATIFLAGLAMVISPAKAGELLKPYLVRVRTGVPMHQTLPVLVTERLTDAIACLGLASISVGRFAGDSVAYVWGPVAVLAVGLGVLAHRGLSLGILRLIARIPGVGRIATRLEEMSLAMRTCVAPVPFLLTVGASFLAWGGECVGYWLMFKGFGIDASLEACTFIYAFATVAGGATPLPGGLGVADGALVVWAEALIPGVDRSVALASAILIRLATLWLGVLLGAVALLQLGAVLDEPAPTDRT